jgi:hypothetical protein
MASSINASTSGGGGVIVTSDASGDLNIQSGGSTVVAVTSAGVAVTGTLSASGASTFTGVGKFATTIGVGNATPSASGSGITFPATQSASSDANTLDDYEEGTFTPVQSGTSIVYAAQGGQYIKIGNQVFFQITISTTSGSPTASITGLPFNCGATFYGMHNSMYIDSGITFPAGRTYATPYVSINTPYIQLLASGSVTAASAVTVASAAAYRVSGTYTTS